MIRKILHITTKEQIEFCNITKDIQNFVKENQIKNGIITVRTLHTTSSIYINEGETGLLKDTNVFLSKILPESAFYHHDNFSVRKIDQDDEYKDRKNGFAHLKALLLGHDVTLAIIDGKLTLGRWQSILFADFDGQRQDRKIEILIYNEEK